MIEQIVQRDQLRKIYKFMLPYVKSIKDEKDHHINKENCHLHMLFHDGSYDHWSYNVHRGCVTIPSDELYPFNEKWPEFRCQYTRTTNDINYEHKGKFFNYTYNYLNEFAFCNRMVFLHNLAYELQKEGFVDLWMPDDKFYNIINNIDFDRIKSNGNVYYNNPHMIKKYYDILLLHDFGAKKYWRNLYYVIRNLYDKKKHINRFNIVRSIKKRRALSFGGMILSLSTLFIREGITAVQSDKDWVRLAAKIAKIDFGHGVTLCSGNDFVLYNDFPPNIDSTLYISFN